MQKFKAAIKIIGINPYVEVPTEVLLKIFEAAKRNKGPIPIKGDVNGKPYQQTLVKYSGAWRLYINLKMLPHSPKRIGEIIEISVAFDPSDRTIKLHPQFSNTLKKDIEAKKEFDKLSQSRQQEIARCLSRLKTEESLESNILRAVNFLKGSGTFFGRSNQSPVINGSKI